MLLDFRFHLQVRRAVLTPRFNSNAPRHRYPVVVDPKLHVETTINVGAPRAGTTVPKQFRRRGGSLGVRFNAHGPVNKRRLFPTNSITGRSRDYSRGGG